MDNQIPRANQADNYKTVDQAKNRKMLQGLPSYMSNINTRLGLTNKMNRTLREVNNHHAKFIDPISTLNTRKEFRHDPKNP